MTDDTAHSPEVLLEHLDWIHRLAHSLCGDAGLAEQVGQETAMSFLLRPPSQRVPVRAWLRTVLRNRVASERVKSRHRRDRERLVARDERLPPTVTLVERASVQQQVVGAVLALREPYRTTLLQRYFEDRTPTEIARHEGLSIETVKTRLRRGLEFLRETLDDAHGADGRTWAVALAPLLSKQTGAAGAAAAGVAIMSMKSGLLAGAFALALFFGWQAVSGTEGSVVTGAAGGGAGAEVELVQGEPVNLEWLGFNVDVGRTEVQMFRAVEAPSTPDLLAGGMDLVVRVVDLSSQPVAGVPVSLAPLGDSTGLALGISGSEGRLRVTIPRRSGFCRVEHPEWATVFEGALPDLGDQAESTVVVTPARDVEGRVVDELGAGIEGATVLLGTSSDLRSRIEFAVNIVARTQFEAVTGPAGQFHFEGAPELPGAFLEAVRPGSREVRVEIAERGSVFEELVLGPGRELATELLGLVVDAGGDPVEGAWVSFGRESRSSDADGRFRLPLEPGSKHDVVRAVMAEFLPAEAHPGADGAWPDPLVLVLGAEPLEMAGRVVTPEGRPVAGATVRVHSWTSFGIVSAEPGRPGAWAANSSGSSAWLSRSVEELIGGSEGQLRTLTDEDGRFRLSGLMDRRYQVVVHDQASLQGNSSEWIAAGEQQARIVLGESPHVERIAGRVVNETGDPIEGVKVRLQREVPSEHERVPMAYLPGALVETGPDGRFEFGPTATEELLVSVVPGPPYPFQSIEFSTVVDPTAIEVVLRGMVEFYVDLGSEPELADEFELLDELGEALFLSSPHGLGSLAVDAGHLSEGRSAVYSVPGGRRTLVLRKGGEEVTRREVLLQGREPQRLGH